MAATEAQRAALARARAARGKKKLVEAMVTMDPDTNGVLVEHAIASPLHDPTGEAYMAEEPPMPDHVPVLDPEIALGTEAKAAPSLFELAQQYLKLTEVKSANGEVLDRCILCDDLYDGAVIRGIHHTKPYRCDCPCHPLRELLNGAH